jgi:hypothetical protein
MQPVGRPTDYTKEMAEKILDLTATTSLSVRQMSEQYPDLPGECTIFRWMRKYPEFRQDYLEAKELQGLLYSDMVMHHLWNVDERTEAISKMNLVLAGAKWHLSKLAPKQFGDKKEVKQEMNIVVHEDTLKQLE